MTSQDAVSVTVQTFIRAESDLYFGRMAQRGLGMFSHRRQMAPIDQQDVVRMNRDTLYSSAVFDLEAGPVSITLPDPGRRFMSMQVISQDHFTLGVAYTPGRYTYTRDQVGTRYVFAVVRLLANPLDLADRDAVLLLQDAIRVEQARTGAFEVPSWDQVSQAKLRDALNVLGSMNASANGVMFGGRDEVNPVQHLIGTAIGWGGNPRRDAIYQSHYPAANDGKTVHTLTVKDVPVDGFWSISVYNADGYFEQNELNAYSLNSLTARPDPDGSYTVQFGGCGPGTSNCLPIVPGWSYTVRLYRPRPEILDGRWRFPEAQPIG